MSLSAARTNAITALQNVQNARRLVELERRQNNETIPGLITGTVVALWEELNSDGAGRVSYKQREYIVRATDFISLPKGTSVQMQFAEGVYYARL